MKKQTFASAGIAAAVALTGLSACTAPAALASGPVRVMSGTTTGVTDSAGHAWSGDAYAVGGQTWTTTAPISGTTDDRIYQGERYGMSGYTIPAPAVGSYEVHLYLAENYFNAPNQRVFDVLAEGTAKATGVDIFARVGRNNAHQIWFSVPVSDGSLNLTFRNRVNLAKVDGIEVIPPSGSTVNVSPVTVPTTTPTTAPTTTPTTTPTTAPTTAPAPVPMPVPVPVPAPVPAGTTRWSGDFESGSTGQWSVLQAATGRVSTYSAGSLAGAPTPLQGRYAARLQAANTDFRSPNVRSQLDGPGILREGDDVYYRFAVNFPTDFPSNMGLGNAFYTFAELMGAPFDGVPANGVFGVRKDSATGPQRICLSRSAEYGYDEPWSIPLVKGGWNDFVLHTKLSQNSSVGFIEIWHNGVKQTMKNGSTRTYQQTYRANNTSGLYPVLTNYRAADSYAGTVTIYADAGKVGTTLSSVMN